MGAEILGIMKMIEVPRQLRTPNFRFLRLREKRKEPIADEIKWQENNYRFDDKILQIHLENNGNYAIIGGYGNLILIDADTKEIEEICESMVETFTIKTGSPEEYKKHYFFITDKKMKGIRLTEKKVGDLGDVRSIGQYVVAPNSIHPKGGIYKVIKDLPIAKVGVNQIKKIFEKYLGAGGNETFKEYPTITTKRSDEFIRNCKVPDYVINNKLPGNTSKNWELFPYLVDILHNREVTQQVYVDLCKRQGHDVGAIKGWVKLAHEGKLMKCSCDKMQNYVNKFHPNMKLETCEKCPVYIKQKEINNKYAELKAEVLSLLLQKKRDDATELIVEYIENNHYIYTTKDDVKSEVWIYKNGVYKSEGKSEIKEIVRKILGKHYTTTIANLIIDKIGSDTQIDADKFFNSNYLEEVPVKNGILNIFTKELSDFNPKKIFFNKIPIEYNPDAICPNILQFFSDVLKDTDDVGVILELFGFALLKEYRIEKALMFVGHGRNGKCLTKGSKVLMPDGSWKLIEKIKVGDKVISPQENETQKIATVIKTHSRFEPDIYEVREQARKKRLLYTCAGNHDIPIIRTYSKRTSKDDSTPRILKRKLFHYEAKRLSKMPNLKSDRCSFTTSQLKFNNLDEKIDPYCLGAWLGDGCLSGSNSSITLGPKKKEIKEYFEEIIGFQASHGKKDSKGVSHRISTKTEFIKYLRKNNIKSFNKFIPKKCLLSSIDFRFNLLAGLIDTDGFIQKKTGAIYYTTKSITLAKNIKDLVFSLGGYCEIRDIEKSCQTGFKGKYKELSIQFKNPLKIPLKTWKKTRLKKPKYDPRHIGINVIKKKKGEMVYGFELDSNETPSQWHITDNWMITHNSKTLELLKRFIGIENCCSVTLNHLNENSFSVSELFSKMVNLAGDLSNESLKNTGMFKETVGRDVISAKRKFLNDLVFTNYAKHIFACNELPKVYDLTDGFWTKWVLLEFPYKFITQKEYNSLESEERLNKKILDPDIIEKITTPQEMSGLLNIALESLNNLLKQRDFSYSKGTNEIKELWVRQSDSFTAFCMDCLEEDYEGKVSKKELRKEFFRYCKKNKLKGAGDKGIKATLENRFGVTEHQEFNGGNRYWSGIKLKIFTHKT